MASCAVVYRFEDLVLAELGPLRLMVVQMQCDQRPIKSQYLTRLKGLVNDGSLWADESDDTMHYAW